MPRFDVFLSHNSQDKPAVRQLKQRLTDAGVRCWLDEEELRPGVPWLDALEDGIRASCSVAVLVGQDGLGPWESEEMKAALQLAVNDKRPVIPVVLPDAPSKLPDLPLFLRNRTWVDLRPALNDAKLDRLIWGITGNKPVSTPMAVRPRWRRAALFAGMGVLIGVLCWLVWDYAALLIVRDGDRHYKREEYADARQRYQLAIELAPHLAEAQFRLGVLSDQAGNADEAIAHYQRAVELDPDTARYANNLAYTLMQSGRYAEALKHYGKLTRFPLAALEAAKAHWALGQFDQAADLQQRAINWLEEHADEGETWYFETQPKQGVRLSLREDKQCYARRALALTRYLQTKSLDALTAEQHAKTCQPLSVDLRQILAADLQRYAHQQDGERLLLGTP